MRYRFICLIYIIKRGNESRHSVSSLYTSTNQLMLTSKAKQIGQSDNIMCRSNKKRLSMSKLLITDGLSTNSIAGPPKLRLSTVFTKTCQVQVLMLLPKLSISICKKFDIDLIVSKNNLVYSECYCMMYKSSLTIDKLRSIKEFFSELLVMQYEIACKKGQYFFLI